MKSSTTGHAGDVRASALWGSGTGTGGGKRRGTRTRARFAVLTAVLVASQLATASFAHAAQMPKSLRDAIAANPTATYQVVVQGIRSASTDEVETNAKKVKTDQKGSAVEQRYRVINAVAGQYTGAELKQLASDPSIGVIVPDSVVKPTGDYSNRQVWPVVHEANTSAWANDLAAPAIAIVDSGVDAGRYDFGGRVVAQVNFTSLAPNSSGDGRGHGTFVASLAAGQSWGYAGFTPAAKIVSLDVLNDNGEGRVSDVIAAADWIYANKGQYNIRVANFSLTASVDSSFTSDPLDKAVERLWLSGVTVVAAAGNYGSPLAPSGVKYAPANDPFVITVGASDTKDTVAVTDDVTAPWSAHGYTFDGFAKPELGAAGRYLNGAVPVGSTMYAEKPERRVGNGYMWMSGTSFSAPIVAGAAAHLLAANPTWTPDQVKGALMLTAAPAPLAVANSLGVGEIKAKEAARTVNPPNPNAALNGFLVPDPNGGPTPVFDSAAWQSTASANAAWQCAAWQSAAWQSAAWNSAAWQSAAWQTAAWQSAAWQSSTTSTATAPAAAWQSSYVD